MWFAGFDFCGAVASPFEEQERVAKLYARNLAFGWRAL